MRIVARRRSSHSRGSFGYVGKPLKVAYFVSQVFIAIQEKIREGNQSQHCCILRNVLGYNGAVCSLQRGISIQQDVPRRSRPVY